MKGKGSQQMGHGRIRIFNGPRSCMIEIDYILQDEPLIKTWVASELTGLAFKLTAAHVTL